MGLKRIFHWGPLTTIVLVVYIFCTTMYCLSIWWPLSSLSGTVNLTVFVLNVMLLLANYFHASTNGPGFVDPGWKPNRAEDARLLQYCSVCCGFKAPRSHHCRSCGRCVMKMDHHCPWINCCVGHENHSSFTRFVFHAPVGCFHSFLIQAFFTYDLTYTEDAALKAKVTLNALLLVVVGVGASLGVTLSVSGLLYFQLRNILYNKTAIEEWIIEKAKDRRNSDDEPFVYPYDVGRWNNWRQVLSLSWYPAGDGIHWPVRKGCDQYTLTKEQLEQKKLKRRTTLRYVCVTPYSGSFSPVSFGCSTFFRVPWDCARLHVKPADNVLITRWRKSWLYGEKVQAVTQGSANGTSKRTTSQPVERQKGWLPAKCVQLASKDD